MQFQPSSLSYGDGTVTITPIDQPTMSESAPSSGGGGGLPAGLIGTAGGLVQSILGIGEDERESVATLEAKLANYQASAARAPSLSVGGIPLPGGKEYYENLVRKTESQLAAARELAAEEKRAADIAAARDVGYTIAVFAGVLILGGIAVNQIQKARHQQAQIRKLG